MRAIWLPLLACLTLPFAAHAQQGMPQPLPPEVLADTADAAKAAWLRDHIVVEGPVTGGLRFAFPEDFYRSRLILLGESHGVAAPQILDLELLAHLNQRIGLRHYLAEVDAVQADYLNRYLDNGDEALLARVFDHWTKTGAQWGNRAFEDKIRGIRRLNATLAPDRRIRLVGIDAVHDWSLVAEWIAQGDAAIAQAIAGAPAGQRGPAARERLGARAGAVADQLRTTLDAINADKDRETIIFENYAHAVRGAVLGDAPAYGLWGMYHVMQAGINGTRPFAARVVSSDLPAAKATASIALLSLDSAVQIPVPTPAGLRRLRLTEFNIDGPFVMVKGAATLRAASRPSSILVFDPGAPGSPISGADFATITTSVGQNFVPDDSGPDAPRLTRYLGIFTDSDWAAPREEAVAADP